MTNKNAIRLAAALMLSGTMLCASGPSYGAPKAAKEPGRVELVDALRKQIAANQQAFKELEQLRQALKEREELVQLGIQRNAELSAIATEVIEKAVDPSDYDPFFQMRRVKMENLRQSYEDRVRAARIYEGTLAPSVKQPMDEELAQKRQAESAASEKPSDPASQQ